MLNKHTFNWLSAFCLIAFVAFSALFNIRAILANTQGVKATLYMRAGRYNQAMRLIRDSFAKQTFTNPEIGSRFYRGVMLANQEDRIDTKQTKKVLDFLAVDFKKQVVKHPQQVRFYLALGKIYYNLTKLLISEPTTAVVYVKKAEAIFKQSILLSPTRQEIYNSLAQITLMQGKNEETRDLLERAVALNPTVAEFHWNLYLVYYRLGNYESAKLSLFKVRLYDYNKSTRTMHSFPAIRHMIEFYEEIGNYQQLPALYGEALKLKPEDEGLRQEFIEARDRLDF